MDYSDRAGRLAMVGQRSFDIYLSSGEMKDLEIAIQLFEEALEASINHPDQAQWLERLGNGYGSRYWRKRDIKDLQVAIQRFEEALQKTQINHPDSDQSRRLAMVGQGYLDKYLHTEDMKDLEIAIQRFEEALETSINHPARAHWLERLGNGYSSRYYRSGEIKDLQIAIQRFEDALQKTQIDYPDSDWSRQLAMIGQGYLDKYLHTEEMKDLEMAIQQFEEALAKTPAYHPSQAQWLEQLGHGYSNQYRRSGEMKDLQVAIQRFEDALQKTPINHPDWPQRLEMVGNRYLDRYIRIGEMKDLEIAIQQFDEALEKTSIDHPDQAERLERSGAGYHNRYTRTGEMKDLEISIQRLEKALEKTPIDHPERAKRLEMAGSGKNNQYLRTGEMGDLNIAIQRFEEALAKTPASDPDQPRRLEVLGTGYCNRYLRTRQLKDIEFAIQQFEKALEKTPVDHPDRAERFEMVGNGYLEKYTKTGNMKDLEISFQRLEEALAKTSTNHSVRAQRLERLGTGYYNQYERNSGIKDLKIAIQRFEEALEKTPIDHPDRARRLERLGNVYRDRYRREANGMDLKISVNLFKEALDHSPAPPAFRIPSGRSLLALYAETKQWAPAYHAASTVLSLIPLLAPRSLQNSDKQHLLTQIVGLASDAAAVAIMAGQPVYDAIKLLESGRGLILSSLSETHDDISDLQQKHREISSEYIALRGRFNTLEASMNHQAPERYNTGQKLEKLIKDIQKLPGFGNFLQPLSEDGLKVAASMGPIVVINVSDYRCDAFIVEKSKISSLQLKRLHLQDIIHRSRNATVDTEVLEWLWDTIAKPVLDTLGLVETLSDGCWPHVWWILTGPLAKMPIHAAGYHHQNSTETVLDRVISSYSSSVGSLVRSYRNRHEAATAGKPGNAVLVGMPELQYAPQEIDKLEGICTAMHLEVNRPQARRKDVHSIMKDCTIFHFAGHGRSDPIDPSKSGLLLSDGLLMVASMTESNIRGGTPFLAYLSACGTGRISHDGLVDEGLHLIGAFQLAGFQHVIGTLWEVNDKSCVEVATMTYEWIKRQEMSHESVSEGLNRATRNLRDLWISEQSETPECRIKPTKAGGAQANVQCLLHDQGEARTVRDAVASDDPPLYWIPYVHFGV